MANGIPPHDQSEVQLDPFDAAVLAFEIRFERDLTTIWDDRESETFSAIVATPVKEKYRAFRQFFEDVKGEIALVVHRYFRSLLRVATANRERLAGQSPLEWTHARILTQVCNFLRLSEVFDPSSVPRTDSRVLASAERIATGKGWLDQEPSDTFVLPRWTEVPHPLDMLWPLHPEARARHDAEIESVSLSRAETLEWVKHVELLIGKTIEQQVEDEMWDGMIEAGQIGTLASEPIASEPAPRLDAQAEVFAKKNNSDNKFVREGDTWLIAFEDEVCRLKARLGLDYIAVILQQEAGKEIGALEMQKLVSGISRCARQELAVKSIEDDRHEQISAEEDDPSVEQPEFVCDEMVDATARRKAEARLKELERGIVYSSEIGDRKEAARLENEHREIESYLRASFNIHGRSRTFPGENERARQSITQRLKDAYRVIRAQAPRTADHLESKIKKGLTFAYLDSSTTWDIHR